MTKKLTRFEKHTIHFGLETLLEIARETYIESDTESDTEKLEKIYEAVRTLQQSEFL